MNLRIQAAMEAYRIARVSRENLSFAQRIRITTANLFWQSAMGRSRFLEYPILLGRRAIMQLLHPEHAEKGF
ncbi:hypothetical protein WJ542_28630 [Paraburkholderia sp. B3]|uniref:hypothetical protein n=1 Tax=Paraburkholderia sp. B3 TaxID=3134791 RepID=UPI00398210C5